MGAGQRHHRAHGISMLELVIVLLVSLILAGVLLPNLLNTIYNIRLRSAANSVAGLLQDAHLRAIRGNTYYPVRCVPAGNCTTFYIDTTAAHNGVTWANTYPTVQLGGNITGRPTGFPDITSMALGFTPLAATALPYFSSRGTPCAVSGTNPNVCLNIDTSGIPASYQIFLTDTRPIGSNGWAAVTVSPAGRIRVWMWNGSAWH